jgi:hypothetical protein
MDYITEELSSLSLRKLARSGGDVRCYYFLLTSDTTKNHKPYRTTNEKNIVHLLEVLLKYNKIKKIVFIVNNI